MSILGKFIFRWYEGRHNGYEVVFEKIDPIAIKTDTLNELFEKLRGK